MAQALLPAGSRLISTPFRRSIMRSRSAEMSLGAADTSVRATSHLLRPQRFHGIYGRGAAGGNDRCRGCKQQDEDSRKCEDGRIDRVDLKQHGTQQVGGKDSTDRADPTAGQSEPGARNENQPHDAGALRTKSQADGHFLGA